jgi:glycosyltransferase involved in cell wall biosynthesis
MPERPRLLYASFDAVPAPKGASVHILQTVRALASVGQVDLLTLPGTLEEAASLPEGVSHLTFEPPEGNFLQRALEWGDHVARRILEVDYRVVHVRSIWEGTPALLLQPERRHKLVYEANGLPSIELKYHYPAVAANRELIAKLRAQERTLLAASQAVITQSRTTRKMLARHGGQGERLHVIPNGIDPGAYQPDPDRSFGNPPRLLYVGTLAPWQGLGFLLAALAPVAREREVRLKVVGSGRKEWRRALERGAVKLGISEAVEILPPVPPHEVPALLAEADICVAPLTITDRNVTQGCCPLKILEYMAAGRPIVAARLPAVCEILTHEETAALYKPDKPRRLTEAILRMLDEPDLARRMAGNAAAQVRERFTWDGHNEAVGHLYRKLLRA